ncbi:dnaJ [Symbiodinium natans]|uniref:DnaJ protein n=1 Tax=Symbiodinium natans TaxID=878477 RepID=A0A812VE96_9DINO|nr:dnaJ [Symbiodinium natans]
MARWPRRVRIGPQLRLALAFGLSASVWAFAFGSGDNPFQVLGLRNDAEDDDVRPAFRRLAKIYHPDVPDTGDERRFRRISWAAEELSTVEGRRQWRAMVAGIKPLSADQEEPDFPTQTEAPFGEYETLEDDVFDLGSFTSAPRRSKKRKTSSFADSRKRRETWRTRVSGRAKAAAENSEKAKIKAKRQREPEPPGHSKDRSRYKKKPRRRRNGLQ